MQELGPCLFTDSNTPKLLWVRIIYNHLIFRIDGAFWKNTRDPYQFEFSNFTLNIFARCHRGLFLRGWASKLLKILIKNVQSLFGQSFATAIKEVRYSPLQTTMSHWKCTRLLSGNLNIENNVASAVPFNLLYVNLDIIFGSGHLQYGNK